MSEIFLVDTHAHLDAAELAGDLEDVLGRARTAGVGRILTVGLDAARSRTALSLAETHEEVFCAVGLHPHEADQWGYVVAGDLAALSYHPKVVAWGEVGLDFYRMHSPRSAQELAFREQIALAAERRLPLIIHVRNAHQEALRIVAEEAASRGVFHCFSGDEQIAERVLELGFYISLAGPLTFRNAVKLARVAERVPLKRLLLETDCPYLAPVPYRGQRNEPAYVVQTAARLAEIKGVDVAEVARVTTRNAKALFGLGL